MMPVLDGWETTRRIKAAPETRHFPVIALTAVQPGNMTDGCSGTWLTLHHCVVSAAKEAVHAAAQGVCHGPRTRADVA